MGLTDRLKDARKLASPIKGKDDFKKTYLDSIIQSDELKDYFFENGNRKDDDRSKYMYSELVRMIDGNYDNYGKFYEKNSLVKRLLVRPLRKVGAGLAAFSHYLLNVYASPGGYYLALAPALGMMAAADLVEGASYLYHNHSGYDLLQIPKIIVESLAEKGLAALPLFVTPGLEATLGNTKFDRAVAKKILYKTRNDFIKKFGKYEEPEEKYKPNIIKVPFSHFEEKKAA